MRIVSRLCDTFVYTVTDAGPCAVALADVAIGTRKLFVDCLLLKVSVEPGDRSLAPAATEIIKMMAARSDSASIIVDGVAEWPRPHDIRDSGFDVLTGLADTLDILAEVTERLEERGELVHLMPFGWNTVRHTVIRSGPGSPRVTQLHPGPQLRARHRHSRAPRHAGSCRSRIY